MKEKLTERERKVLYYLIKGLTNNDISKELNISVHTVKAHLESIYYKLEVSNRVQAAMKAISNDLFDLKTVA